MEKLLHVAGVTVLAFIEKNIKNGVSYDGDKFEYSKNPFFRPYDQKIYKKLGGKNAIGTLFNIVHSKNSGKMGMIILGGYDEYKRKMHPSAYNSFLTVSGKMLRSMNLKVSANEAIIGFSGEEENKRAYWLNVSGAGRSRKLWKFLGISENQKEKLKKLVADEYKKIIVEDLGRIIVK